MHVFIMPTTLFRSTWWVACTNFWVLEYIEFMLFMTLVCWTQCICILHDCCVIEHCVCIIIILVCWNTMFTFLWPLCVVYISCVVLMCWNKLCSHSSWHMWVWEQCICILTDSYVFAFFITFVLQQIDCVSVPHDLCVGTQCDCFAHDSFVLEHSAFGYL